MCFLGVLWSLVLNVRPERTIHSIEIKFFLRLAVMVSVTHWEFRSFCLVLTNSWHSSANTSLNLSAFSLCISHFVLCNQATQQEVKTWNWYDREMHTAPLCVVSIWGWVSRSSGWVFVAVSDWAVPLGLELLQTLCQCVGVLCFPWWKRCPCCFTEICQ